MAAASAASTGAQMAERADGGKSAPASSARAYRQAVVVAFGANDILPDRPNVEAVARPCSDYYV